MLLIELNSSVGTFDRYFDFFWEETGIVSLNIIYKVLLIFYSEVDRIQFAISIQSFPKSVIKHKVRQQNP